MPSSPSSHQKLTLTSKQMRFLRSEFQLWDKDDSGSIDASELGAMLHSLGIELKRRAVGALLYRYDADHSGAIGFDEFCEMMSPYYCVEARGEDMDPREVRRLVRLFSRFDADGSGFIDTRELGRALRADGLAVTDAQAANIVRVYDADGNGSISFREFVEIMAKPTGRDSGD
jgi:calmodulin